MILDTAPPAEVVDWDETEDGLCCPICETVLLDNWSLEIGGAQTPTACTVCGYPDELKADKL